MDARSFGMFLKNVLIKEAGKYEQNLLSASFETIQEAKRIGGIRDTLIGIADSVEKVLNDFYAKGGNSLPQEEVK